MISMGGRRGISALALALTLTGCAKVRHPTTYSLVLPAPESLGRIAKAPLGPVAVQEFRCPDYICEGRIVYRPSAEEVGFYEYHRWAVDPRESITRHAADVLQRQGVFERVALREPGVQPSYILSGRLVRLEEVDEGRQVSVVCSVSAQLREANTGTVIWRGAATKSVPVERRTVAGVVNSLSIAAHAAVTELAQSMAKQIRSDLASQADPSGQPSRMSVLHPTAHK